MMGDCGLWSHTQVDGKGGNPVAYKSCETMGVDEKTIA